MNGTEVKSTINSGPTKLKHKKKVKPKIKSSPATKPRIYSPVEATVSPMPEKRRHHSIYKSRSQQLESPTRPFSLPLIEKTHGISGEEQAKRSSTGDPQPTRLAPTVSNTSLSLEIDVSSSNVPTAKERRQWREFSTLTEDHRDTDGLCDLVRLVSIGKGSSAYVYKSVLFPSLRVVADKVVVISNKEKSSQLVRELKSLRATVLGTSSSSSTNSSKPTSSNIVRLLEVYPNPRDGTISVCLEYMDGGSLQDVVRGGGCQCESVLAGLARQMLRGLAFLHSKRHIHRDIKPGNILMCSGRGTTNGSDGAAVKISDFGLSKELEKGHSLADSFLGTFHYMSPERIAGGDYSFSSDIWSFGMTILAVALGRYPFSPGSPRLGLTGKGSDTAGYGKEGEGGYWAILQAIQERPSVRSLLQSCQHSCESHTHSFGMPMSAMTQQFTQDFHSFLSLALHRDQKKRPTAASLLQHAFLTNTTTAVEEDATKEFILQCCARHSEHIESRGVSATMRPRATRARALSGDEDDGREGGKTADNSVHIRQRSRGKATGVVDPSKPRSSGGKSSQDPGIKQLRKILRAYREYMNRTWGGASGLVASARAHGQPMKMESIILQTIAPLLEPSTIVNLSVQLNAPVRLVKKGFRKIISEIKGIVEQVAELDPEAGACSVGLSTLLEGGFPQENRTSKDAPTKPMPRASPAKVVSSLEASRIMSPSGTGSPVVRRTSSGSSGMVSRLDSSDGSDAAAVAEIRALVSSGRQNMSVALHSSPERVRSSVIPDAVEEGGEDDEDRQYLEGFADTYDEEDVGFSCTKPEPITVSDSSRASHTHNPGSMSASISDKSVPQASLLGKDPSGVSMSPGYKPRISPSEPQSLSEKSSVNISNRLAMSPISSSKRSVVSGSPHQSCWDDSKTTTDSKEPVTPVVIANHGENKREVETEESEDEYDDDYEDDDEFYADEEFDD